MTPGNNPMTQIAAPWSILLAQATAAGMSRGQIALATLQTMYAIGETTAEALWGESSPPEEAEVHFQITIRGTSDADADQLAKKNGRWWIRVKEDPKEAAAQFRQVFGDRIVEL